MRKNLLTVSLAVCCGMILSTAVGLAADNWIGIWKLDVAKSKYSPGPAPRGQMLKFVHTKDGIQLIADGITGDGTALHSTYVSHFDGHDVAWTGNPDADMAAPKKIDDNTYENTWKKDGKAIMTARVVVSADGKNLTVSQTGTNAKGQAVNITSVYARQE